MLAGVGQTGMFDKGTCLRAHIATGPSAHRRRIKDSVFSFGSDIEDSGWGIQGSNTLTNSNALTMAKYSACTYLKVLLNWKHHNFTPQTDFDFPAIFTYLE
jgi:hypothetical protein